MPKTKHKDTVAQYMLAYMQELQTQAPAERIYSQMGWKKDGSEFVMGDICYRADGTASQIKLLEQYTPLITNFDTMGSLDIWKGVTGIYKDPIYKEYALAFMIGFGSPMFEYSGFEGGIFSLNGPSGGGKSTALRAIHSIFGRPLHNVLLKKDTENSKYVILGAYNNLPVTLDEITNISPEEASALTFSITDGRDKRRLTADASLKSMAQTWRLPMYVTTNRSLSQMILTYKPEASGEMMRILERRVIPSGLMTFADARKWFEPLDANYGVAGPILIAWYVANLPEAKRLFGMYIDKLSDAVQGLVPERFWLAMCALALLGCHVGKLLGLHDYDEDEIFAHCCVVVLESRVDISSQSKTAVDVLTDFLNAYVGDTLVVHEGIKGKPSDIRLKPRSGNLTIRTEVNAGRIYIDKTAIRNYCTLMGHDFGGVEKELHDGRVLLRKDAYKRLGESTEYSGGLTKAWLVDGGSALLGGVKQLVVQEGNANESKENKA